MFCEKCGRQNVNGAKFCSGCGNSLQPTGSRNYVKPTPAKPGKKKSGIVPVLILLLVFVLLVGIAAAGAIFVISNQKVTINLNDYVSIETKGMDGFGKIEQDIDWDAIEDEYAKKLKFTASAKRNNSTLIEGQEPLDLLMDSVELVFDKKEGLNNGEDIPYKWEIDEDSIALLKCTLNYSDGSFKVENLTEVAKFDPFMDVSVGFNGVSPYGELVFEYSGSDFGLDDFAISKTENLKNGDEVTISLQIDDLEEYVKENGKAPEKTENTYTVEGLAEVESFDPFADVTVTFSGVNEEGTLQLEYSGRDFRKSDFHISQADLLKNGDVVSIILQIDDPEQYARENGRAPSKTVNNYTVSGLPERVEGFAGLPEEFKKLLKSEAEDTVISYTAKNYKYVSLSGLSYAGYIMNTPKDSDKKDSNDLYIILAGDVTSNEGRFENVRTYYPVWFRNVMAGSECTYDKNEGIYGHSVYDDNSTSTKGYINPVEFYINIVESNRDRYSSECGDGFEIFSANEPIETLSDIDDSYKQVLIDRSKGIVEDYVRKHFNENEQLGTLSVAGEYLLVNKSQGTDFDDNNRYIVVLTSTVTSTNGRFPTSQIYFPVRYDGLVKFANGTFIDSYSGGIQGFSQSPRGKSYCDSKGYFDGAEMYNDLIAANRTTYTYEVSDSLKKFGN